MGLTEPSMIKVSSAKLRKTQSSRPKRSPADRAGAGKTITISGAQVRAARAFLGGPLAPWRLKRLYEFSLSNGLKAMER